MYKQKLCLALMDYSDMSEIEQAKIIKKVGFDGFAIDDCRLNVDVEPLVSFAKNENMIISYYHAPFNKSDDMWNPEEIGEKARTELLGCVETCAKYEIPVMVAHAFLGDEDDFVSVEAGLDRYGSVARRASELGVRLALENTEGEKWLDVLMKNLSSEKSVGFCWDTGHELCYNHSNDMTSLYGDKLIVTHLNDNLRIRDFNGNITWHDDLHLLPFDGITDWDSVGKRLAKCGFSDPLTFELSAYSKPNRHENDGYLEMGAQAYFTEAFKRACRVATLKLKHERN